MSVKKRKRTLLLIAGILLAVLLLFCLLNHRSLALTYDNLRVKKYDYHPEEQWDGGKTHLNIPYAAVSESDYLNLYVPETEGHKPPLFVLIHGGGFVAGAAETKQTYLMYRYFRDHGYAVASINYRLAQEAPFPAAIEDCKAAIRYLRANSETYGYDAERIAVFGESAGGYLATMCAFTNESEFNDLAFIGQADENNPSAAVDALVDYYPYVSLTGLDADLKQIGCSRLFYTFANMWTIGNTGGYEDFTSYWLRSNISGMTPEQRSTADPFRYLEKNAAELKTLSVWLIHGNADITVPIPSSDRLYLQLRECIGEDHVIYRTVPHMGHASDPLYEDAILSEIDMWMSSILAKDR